MSNPKSNPKSKPERLVQKGNLQGLCGFHRTGGVVLGKQKPVKHFRRNCLAGRKTIKTAPLSCYVGITL